MTTSSSFTDPFSAVYKARPGQLPSFFSIENYQTVRKPAGDEDNRNIMLPAATTSDRKEISHQSALDRSQVFSSLLAGERDRLVRKRILSNPEHFFVQRSMDSSASRSSTLSPSKTPNIVTFDLNHHHEDGEDDVDDFSWTTVESSDSNDSGDDEEAEDQFPLSRIQLRFVTNNASDNTLERCPIPARSSVFFSPPKNLPSPNRIQETRDNRGPKRLHLEEDSKSTFKSGDRNIFSAVFSNAMLSGSMNFDFDNKKIERIPDLSNLLRKYTRRVGCYQEKEAETMTGQIDRMINLPSSSGFSNRQPMTRVRSAPLVSFSPHTVFTMILSNNYLNSNFGHIQRICYLQGLEVLSLRANLLTEIPSEFGDLKNLKELNLSNNLLNFLPSSILKLKNCRFLLNGNPWFKPSSSDRSHRKFQWISKPKQVFYLHSPGITSFHSSQRSVPSLMESCIRKLCITKDSSTGEEKIIDHHSTPQSSLVNHPNEKTKRTRFSNFQSSSPLSTCQREALLPKPMKRILSSPHKNFHKCELCKKRLILNSKNELLIDGRNDKIFDQDHHHVNEFFQFTQLNQHETNLDPHHLQDEEEKECDNPGLNNSIPIRWIACSFDCCVENLIHC